MVRLCAGLAVVASVAVVAACKTAPAGPASEPLTQAYSTPNGLITVHYPAAFAASVGSDSRIQLNRTRPVATSLSLSAIETPVSNDLGEFARVVFTAMTGALQGYQEIRRAPGTCNGVAGILAQGTYRGDDGAPAFWSACAFLRNGHGYTFFYVLAQADVPTWAPLLQAILDSTTFNR